jgi:hypothetical protein
VAFADAFAAADTAAFAASAAFATALFAGCELPIAFDIEAIIPPSLIFLGSTFLTASIYFILII